MTDDAGGISRWGTTRRFHKDRKTSSVNSENFTEELNHALGW